MTIVPDNSTLCGEFGHFPPLGGQHPPGSLALDCPKCHGNGWYHSPRPWLVTTNLYGEQAEAVIVAATNEKEAKDAAFNLLGEDWGYENMQATPAVPGAHLQQDAPH